MKKLLFTFFTLLCFNALQAEENVHSFSLKDIDGKEIKLSQFKGKKLLLVNVASQCGLTKQYAALQKLHDTYNGKGLVIIGIPANNFGAQEPGTNAEIKTFCTSKFNVTFPMMSKIEVKGKKQDPLYKYLTSHETFGGEISWNFEKFLIDDEGNIIKRFKPRTKPDSKEVISKIEGLLK